jgi:hypothetical protein
VFTDDEGLDIVVTDAVYGNVDNQFDSGANPSIAVKASPLGADRILIEDSEASGAKKYAIISSLPIIPGDVETVVATALKASVGTITKGEPIYTVGWDIGNACVTVELADASSSATMPAFAIAAEDITNTVTGTAIINGEMLNTLVAGLTTGDSIYISETPGALTSTKPTGTALIQKVGTCIRHTGEVNIQVSGAGRTNDIPNIPEDDLWLGNASGVATAISRSGIDDDAIHSGDTITAAQHGDQTDEGLHAIVVDGVSDGFMTGAMATTLAATDAAGTARPPTSHAYDSHSGTVPIDNFAGTPTGTGDIVFETSPTIVTPVIVSFNTAQHDHADGPGGGTIAYADITDTPTIPSAPTLSKGGTLLDPVTGNEFGIYKTLVAITATDVVVGKSAGTSVAYILKFGTGRDVGGTTIHTATTTSEAWETITPTGTLAIPADSVIWVEATTVTGSVTEFHCSLVYTED